jgi:hypothetical protein
MIIMLTNEQLILIGVVVGFIPYFVKKQQTKRRHVLEVRALFWSVQYAGQQWIIRVTLIERLRRSIWTVIAHLREDEHSKDDDSQE